MTATDFATALPHDFAAEQAVLGAMLLSADAITEVRALLDASAFYRPAHQIVFAVIADIAAGGEPADAVTLVAELARRGDLARVGGGPYVHTLLASVPTAANAGYYARIVAEHARRREVIAAGTRLVQVGHTLSDEPDALRAWALEQLSATSGATWPTPMPLGVRGELPAFPVDALPTWLGDFVSALAVETQTPVDLAGCLALAVLSTAAGGRALVVVRGMWVEPVNIFTVVAMPPASRKSPVFKAMVAPIMRAERHLQERVQPQRAEAELARQVSLRTAEKAARRASDTVVPGGDADALADATSAALAAQEITVPELPQLVTDDVTPETAASLLAKQGGRLAVLSAEGGIFATLAGRYSGMPNLDLFLKGHAGDMLRVDRQSRAPEHVDSACLTLGLALQPEVVRDIADMPGFRGKGLLGRILYALPASNIGRRDTEPPVVPDLVAARYDTKVHSLVNDLYGWDDPMRLQLSAPAAQLRADLSRTTEPRLHPQHGDLGHLGDWAGKYVGAVCRIAGLLHLADHGGAGHRHPISGPTMAAAVRIGEYYAEHAKAAFDTMGAAPGSSDARFLLDWLTNKRTAQFTVRELFTALPRGRFRRVGDLTPAISVLEEHGWVRELSQPKRKGRGRPASPKYATHPDIHQSGR
ncbi:DUF3987 domain-containing protein [Allonocardiopsis opalescens]|uniref:DnaB helicase-like protein n=1 Tax=Allonocardiopsis opalescens TaxID=1144618 RepID=A0A2T0Q763_9ACTN|nr:DUF3987 domain-containing protein [Allonocardiopsis opalescens]PRX99652.1 DnaB helicase-like protein [Allonocardiopsis opalescens]